ncbi:MAG: 2-amino-4-hydroxy-6-hydroxymethyldihydropteridine diphosphokinase [Frankiaceae bacterium]
MTAHRAVIALGSNLGDRAGHLRRGLRLLAAHDDVRVTGASAAFETAPVGGPDDQPAYLNAVAAVGLTMPPHQLLGLLHVVEAACERTREVRWGPRTLDLDVLAYDDLVSADPVLTLPHPRAHERAFVLAPWLDLDPLAAMPGHGPVAALLERLDRSGVRRTDVHLEVPS